MLELRKTRKLPIGTMALLVNEADVHVIMDFLAQAGHNGILANITLGDINNVVKAAPEIIEKGLQVHLVERQETRPKHKDVRIEFKKRV